MFKIFFGSKQEKEKTKSPQPQKNQIIAVTQGANAKRKDLSSIQPSYRIANQYQVIKKLGEGGFGATFLVKDLTKAVPVTYVAKLQKLGDDAQVNADLLQRFNQEAKTLQNLGTSHGQIPSLIDFFDFEGNFYLIQEFVRGQSLTNALVEKLENNYVFSEKKAIEIILSLLEVLESVHQEQIIHRDIKPDNIILREGDGKPVLIDFGIIKDAAVSNLGETGTVIGTPGFCAFEQSLGKPLFQSDLYAVGMTLLVLITGVAPHRIPVTKDFQLDLSLVEDDISPPLFDWLNVAVAVLPQNRFESATKMRETLLNIYNLEYVAKGMEIAQEAHQNEIERMKAEIQSLKEQLKQTNSQGKKGTEALIEDLKETPEEVAIPEEALQIVTTQLEINGFNAIKRLFDRNGLDKNRLEMKDTVEYCGINIDGDEYKTLIRLYFNDEDNLSFAIVLADGQEEKFPINTIKGIAPKKDKIITRAKELMNVKIPASNSSTSFLDIASQQLELQAKKENNQTVTLEKKAKEEELSDRELIESLIEENYKEPITLLYYQQKKSLLGGLFLEKRREWVFDFQLDLERQSISYQPNQFIRNISDEVLSEVYPKLEKVEKQLIFNLIRLTYKFRGEVYLLSEDEFTEKEDKYDFYPHSQCFPIIIYYNPILKMTGGFYTFKNSKQKSSLEEQIILDDNDESATVFEDTSKAINFLIKRMQYYIAES